MIFPKIRTILFTEACQLNCNYCNLQCQSGYATKPPFSKERFFAEVEKAKEDGCDSLLFTGGEPFLYFDWIKEIMEKYKGTFTYSFNTNGEFLTFDVCQFLSNYIVNLNLSIDGPREIAMWRRPNAKNLEYDYWDKFEKNIPHILYFFPYVTWKSIISKRLIPYLAMIYSAAANYGFRNINFELDFNEQTWRETSNGEPWTDNDWEQYNFQMGIITSIMVNSIENGAYPLLEKNTMKYLHFLMKEEQKIIPHYDNVACGISGGRDLVTIYSQVEEDRDATCLGGIMIKNGWDREQLIKEIEKDFEEGCAHKKGCVLEKFCMRYGCIKDSFTATGQFSTLPKEYCLQNLIARQQVMDFLEYGMKNFCDNKVYGEFLAQFLTEKGGCE